MTIAKNPTPQQTAILKFVRDPSAGNLVIDALAGSGKTSTILEALKGIPQKSILLTAFNKRIADELGTKLPKLPKTHVAHVKTFHSLGLAMIKNARPELEVSRTATEDLVNRVCKRVLTFNQRRWICRLLNVLKDTTVELDLDPEEVMNIGFDADIFGQKAQPNHIDEAVEVTLSAYQASMEIDQLTSIDFSDMTWLPVVAKLKPVSRYQAIVVDELQDISEPQFELLRQAMLPTTRIIAVGDINQAIYGWRGGLGARAWAIMQNEFKASTLNLTVTFRCAQEIADEARVIVPSLHALPDSSGGSVTTIAYQDLPSQFVGGITNPGEIHTFVLSRRNDDLLDCAMFLRRGGVKFQLNAGKELLSPLFYLLDFVLDLTSPYSFDESLKKWRDKELEKADKHNSPSMADRCEQQFFMMSRSAKEVAKPTLIKGLLFELLHEGNTGILLSTVHKVKGLEADRVYLLKRSFARHRLVPYLDSSIHAPVPNTDQEELNLEYVGITRARHHLIWVDNRLEQKIDVGEAGEMIAGISAGVADLALMSRDQLDEKFCLAEREAQRLAAIKDKNAQAWADYANALLTEINSRPKDAR